MTTPHPIDTDKRMQGDTPTEEAAAIISAATGLDIEEEGRA